MGDYAKIRFKENKSLQPFFEGGARGPPDSAPLRA